VGGGLTARFWVVRKLMPVTLDCSSGRDHVGKSSPKGCSRSAKPPRTSQVATGTKREHNCSLEEIIRAKEIKSKNIDKFLVDAIGIASIGHVTFII
jgi:hypothetical protein